MMTNVIAFPQPKTRNTRRREPTSGAKTLFVHIRQTTLIAHLTGRVVTAQLRDERVGKT